jgi:hypothetical protein
MVVESGGLCLVSSALELACGVMVALWAASGFFSCKGVAEVVGVCCCLGSYVFLVWDSAGRKPSPTFL